MRLLLADDDEILRCMLVHNLTQSGHSVEEAVDGTDALVKINNGKYDAVICDWEMPNLDGPDLCPGHSRAGMGGIFYVIMLTGRDDFFATAQLHKDITLRLALLNIFNQARRLTLSFPEPQRAVSLQLQGYL